MGLLSFPSIFLPFSFSHSRSRMRLTAPIRSRKSKRRRGSVTNRRLWLTPRNRIPGGCGALLSRWSRRRATGDRCHWSPVVQSMSGSDASTTKGGRTESWPLAVFPSFFLSSLPLPSFSLSPPFFLNSLPLAVGPLKFS